MGTDTADSYIAIIIDGDNSHILTWHFDESISWDRWPTLWYIVSLISVISSVPLWWDFIATPVGIDLQGLPAEGTDPTAKLEAPAHVHRLGEVNVHDNGAYNTSRQKLWRVIVCWPHFLPPRPLFPPVPCSPPTLFPLPWEWQAWNGKTQGAEQQLPTANRGRGKPLCYKLLMEGKILLHDTT